MEKQEKLFKLLKEEQVEHRYEPALPLASIVEPDDAVEPLRELVEARVVCGQTRRPAPNAPPTNGRSTRTPAGSMPNVSASESRTE